MGDLISAHLVKYKNHIRKALYLGMQGGEFSYVWSNNENAYRSWNSPPSNIVWEAIGRVHGDLSFDKLCDKYTQLAGLIAFYGERNEKVHLDVVKLKAIVILIPHF